MFSPQLQPNAQGWKLKLAHKKAKSRRHMVRSSGDNGKSTRKHITSVIFSRADGKYRVQRRNDANLSKPIIEEHGAPCPLVVHCAGQGSKCTVTSRMKYGLYNERGVSDTGIEVRALSIYGLKTGEGWAWKGERAGVRQMVAMTHTLLIARLFLASA